MAELTLKIIGNIDDVTTKVSKIRDTFKNNPIKISIHADGLDAVASKLKEISADNIKAAESAAKLANAEARKINAQTRAAESAAKLSRAQKEQVQTAQAADNATKTLALTNEQLRQKMESAATQTEFMRKVAQSLYERYVQLASAAQSVSSGQTAISSAFSQTSVKVEALNDRLRETLRLFLQAKGYSSGSFYRPYIDPGQYSGADSSSQGGALSTYVNPYNYFDWSVQPNWTYGTGFTDAEVIDVTPVETIKETEAAVRNTTSAFTTLRDGMGAAWAKMSEGTPIADALGDSIGNIIVKITTWQVVNGIVASIKRSFKEALETMKAVDQELTNIAKVSDLTEAQINRIGEGAYDVASKYGVAADEYLKAVYTFQKAGLGDSAEQMAELATKTMLVGDTTADVATKFLISANAAWKFGGNVAELSRIVDEADWLNNRYAVSLQDIAEGLPIVGAAAAQVGLSAEQTMAAISTIVASTGQSATKAATALRAVIANLVNDVGEYEEGFSVTEETVKNLNAVMNQYAGSAMKAAEAEGKMVDPMIAIASLAKAAEEGFLSEKELFDILYSEGGKLRVTQLSALVNAQDMYNSMLADTADAAGTADKEISVMLESWNSKTQILKNNFTQFISHLVSSKGIKAAIDILNSLVKVLDSGIGKFAATTAAVLALGKAIAMIGKSNIFNFLLNEILGLAAGTVTATTAIADLWALLSTSPLFWAAAIAGAVMAINAAVDALTTSYKEQKRILDDIQSNYDQLYGVGTEYDNLKNKVDDLTEAEKRRLIVLEAEAKAEHDKLVAQQQQAFLQWRTEQKDKGTTTPMSPTGSQYAFQIVTTDATRSQVSDTRKALDEAAKAYRDGTISATEYKDALLGLVAGMQDSVDAINLGVAAGEHLTQSESDLLLLFNTIVGIIGRITGAKKADTQATDENADATRENASAHNALKNAFEEVEKKSSLTYGTLAKLEKLYPGLSARILDANGKLTDEGKAALESKAAFYDLISSMISANTTGLNFDSQIAALQALATEAGIAAGMVSAIFSGLNAETGSWDEVADMTPTEYAQWRMQRAISSVRDQVRKTTIIPAAPSGSGGSSSEEEKDEELERLKAIVSLRKQELSFLKESGASDEDILAKQKEIQAALHDEAEYLRSTEAYLNEDADALREVTALSTEWWSIQNDINDAVEKTAKKLRDDISDTLKDIADSLKESSEAMIKPLQEQLDALEATRDAAKDRREEEEKILAVEKARIALENAQNERTVRQYNAETGQWEWVADAKKVESAQQSLADAQAALAQYYEDQKYEAQKAALEAQINNAKNAFSALQDAINEAAQAIKDGKMTFADAYAYIKAAMQQIYDDYGIDLTGELDSIISGFGTVNENIRALVDSIIETLSEAYFAAKAVGDWQGMENAHDAANGLRALIGDDPTDASVDIANTRRAAVIAEMQANSAAWFDASPEEKQRLADRNLELGSEMGWHRGSDGAWYDEDNNRVYDRGGVLHGMGGIKATREDELILPPDITAKLLKAENSGGFDALLAHLGIVTAAGQSYKAIQAGRARDTIGTQNNGNTYNFGGISLSEQQARSMTVYDLAQMARNLAIAT